MFQHNEAMDIRSKPTFVPRGHHFLFAILLVCLFTCMFARILYAMLVIAILLVRFVPFCYYVCISPFPLLVCWFLVFAFVCTHMKRGHMELGHNLLGTSKKGSDVSLLT